MRSAAKIGLTLLAIALLGTAIGLRARTVTIYDAVIDDDHRFYLPPPAWLRVFSMGYNEAAADLVWIKAITYFGQVAMTNWENNERRGKSNYTVNYLSVAADLNPRFRAVYAIGSSLTLYHQGTISEQTTKAAIELIEKGIEQYPGDGELMFDLGFLHYYEMERFLPDDPQDPKRRFHKETGVRCLRKSATLEGSPRYASLLSTSLLKKEGLNDLVLEHLRTMLIKETDPTMRRSLESQLREKIGAAADRDILRTKRLQDRWAEELPYISYDLFLIMDSPPPFDANEMVNPLLRFDFSVIEEEPVDRETPTSTLPHEKQAE